MNAKMLLIPSAILSVWAALYYLRRIRASHDFGLFWNIMQSREDTRKLFLIRMISVSILCLLSSLTMIILFLEPSLVSYETGNLVIFSSAGLSAIFLIIFCSTFIRQKPTL